MSNTDLIIFTRKETELAVRLIDVGVVLQRAQEIVLLLRKTRFPRGLSVTEAVGLGWL